MNEHAADKTLFYAILLLILGGLLILTSASMVLSQKNAGNIFYYGLRQLGYAGAGFAIFTIIQKINYRVWKKLALVLMIIAFLMLAALFLPKISFAAGGARRWLQLGPLTVQPSEVLKIAFISYLASWLDEKRKEVGSISYGMIPFMIMLGVVGMFLVMQPDIGTLMVIVITAISLYAIGGGKKSQIYALLGLGAVMLYLLVQLAPYRLQRILVFLNPGADPAGIGYQINQAFIAIGSGGFGGVGFGRSLQKFNYLPEPMGDSIFAVFSEELGFLGAAVLIALFAFIFWKGMLIAKRAPDVFGKLLAAGISINLMAQAFINMAAISGLVPLTGIPLPLISYGGTSLVITLASLGILLNISKYT